MVFDWKWFGEEIGFVFVASFPDDSELSFTYSVSNPVMAHRTALEILDADLFGGGFLFSGFVSGDGCSQLCEFDIFQDFLENADSLAGNEESCVLSFGN